MTVIAFRRARTLTLLPAVAALGTVLIGAMPAQATQYGSHEVHGDIEVKYLAKCGPSGVLGSPITNETATPDRVGRYNAFLGGSIYWTPTTGAQELHGAIRDAWSAVGWEAGPLGYPITDETSTPGILGRYNAFQRGSIYWSPATGAHEVYGAIRETWASVGWEGGILGFPTSGEFGIPGGRMNTFEAGDITWTPAGGAVVHINTPLPPRAPATPVPPTCAVLPPGPTPPQPGPAPIPHFANCTDMHNAGYIHGIGRLGAIDSNPGGPRVTNYFVSDQGYNNNAGSDRDGDLIACEQ